MKKLLVLAVALLMLVCSMSSCSKNNAQEETASASVSDKEELAVDIDLSELSSNMVYSQVYSMMTEPEKYEGTVVKMRGTFNVYTDMEKMKNYYACLISDATACCQQGIEFSLEDKSKTYTRDYPQKDTEIEVTGRFSIYYEDGNRFCELADSTMTVL